MPTADACTLNEAKHSIKCNIWTRLIRLICTLLCYFVMIIAPLLVLILTAEGRRSLHAPMFSIAVCPSPTVNIPPLFLLTSF